MDNDNARKNETPLAEWKIAEYDTLRKLAIAYRAAQRKYFKTRSATDLRVAKDYERRLDDELKRPAGAPPPPRQP